MERKALNIVAIIAAKLASGQLTLEAAAAFANSGELGDIVLLPTLGEIKNFPCQRCDRPEKGNKEETPHVFTSHYHKSFTKEPAYTIFRWDCTCCGINHHPVWDTRSGQKSQEPTTQKAAMSLQKTAFSSSCLFSLLKYLSITPFTQVRIFSNSRGT